MSEIKLILGDCLEVMKSMASDSVDLVVTSPPYNLGNNHHTGNIRHSPYEDNLPEEEYRYQQLMILQEIYRVVNDTGSLFYNHKNRIKAGISFTPYDWILKSSWYVKQELVWFNRSQNFDKIRFYPMTERVYWLAKSPDTKLFNSINHHDLFNWTAVGTSKEHKRAFPESMVSDILQCFPDAKTILDPYCGSGTVGVVCKKMKKDFIGIEISPEYMKIAEQRLKNTSELLL